MVPFFSARDVAAAVPPETAYAAVREAFVAHARSEWTMQPKLYVTNYPAGDFRAMPALGGGHTLLKWVTSFPGNPLPWAADGHRARRALERRHRDGRGDPRRGGCDRTPDWRGGGDCLRRARPARRRDAAVIGAGVNGRAAAQTFVALGRSVSLWDVDAPGRRLRQRRSAPPSLAERRRSGADLLVTVTPGRAILSPRGRCGPDSTSA